MADIRAATNSRTPASRTGTAAGANNRSQNNGSRGPTLPLTAVDRSNNPNPTTSDAASAAALARMAALSAQFMRDTTNSLANSSGTDSNPVSGS